MRGQQRKRPSPPPIVDTDAADWLDQFRLTERAMWAALADFPMFQDSDNREKIWLMNKLYDLSNQAARYAWRWAHGLLGERDEFPDLPLGKGEEQCPPTPS